MVVRKSVCLNRLAGGLRAGQVRFGRFLANQRVTVEGVIEGWGDRTKHAAKGLHVLAIQDTSEIKFATTQETRRDLGKIKKGNVFGVLLHAMLGVDAKSGACLGLVSGKVWTRAEVVKVAHAERPVSEKESHRWLTTAQDAKEVLSQASMITVIGDRESDFFVYWASVPQDNVHLISRAMHDHALLGGGTLRETAERTALAEMGTVELRERAHRRPREAKLGLYFGTVVVKRPWTAKEENLPDSVTLTFVQVRELDPAKNVEPIDWLLLTTHALKSAADAWHIVDWYKQRWIIEQFFRELKTQGLQIEDSQFETADRLIKLVAIAAKAAAIIIQLVQARDGKNAQLASLAFTPGEIDTLKALNQNLQAKTALQKNPHKLESLAWAAGVIAKLGGWDGYPSSKPPGPITFHHGLTYFRAVADGWALRDLCMP